MAKNLNSISFTVLLLVLVMASTGILKSEAEPCGDLLGCPLPNLRTFLGECPSANGGTNAACCTCCKDTYKTSPDVPCWALVEGSDKHCHCYKKATFP